MDSSWTAAVENRRTDMWIWNVTTQDGLTSGQSITSSQRCGKWSGLEAGKQSLSGRRRGVVDAEPSEATADCLHNPPHRRVTHGQTEAETRSTAPHWIQTTAFLKPSTATQFNTTQSAYKCLLIGSTSWTLFHYTTATILHEPHLSPRTHTAY